MSDGVTDLLVRWEAERVAGRELSAEELCADCPALLEPVREGIRRLLWVNAVNEEASGTGGQSPRWTKGESPLPGFTLIEDQPFAKGGCGGVWRAVAPGGFRHVLKRVRLEGDLGPEEERAMTLLPSLRGHPHLLEVLAVRCFDKELVVAMEEADCSLKDRLDDTAGARGSRSRKCWASCGRPPREWIISTNKASSTATSSRATCCSREGRSRWATTAWPRYWSKRGDLIPAL